MKYAKIIDKGECMSTLHLVSSFPWPNQALKNIANKEEWFKYNFYPSNGLVAEVPHTVIFKQPFTNKILDVYILKITNHIYVPITRDGIEFISQEMYLEEYPNNELRDMDSRQERLNDKVDFWNSFSNHASTNFVGGRFPFGIEKEAEIYCNSAKFSLSNHSNIYDKSVDKYANHFKTSGVIYWDIERFSSEMIIWTKFAVTQQGWNESDEDGVAFYIGLFTKGYCHAINKPSLFDSIFKKAFIKYYSN